MVLVFLFLQQITSIVLIHVVILPLLLSIRPTAAQTAQVLIRKVQHLNTKTANKY